MKRPLWMIRKGISWSDLIKISAAMGSLALLVVIGLIGGIGACL